MHFTPTTLIHPSNLPTIPKNPHVHRSEMSNLHFRMRRFGEGRALYAVRSLTSQDRQLISSIHTTQLSKQSISGLRLAVGFLLGWPVWVWARIGISGSELRDSPFPAACRFASLFPLSSFLFPLSAFRFPLLLVRLVVLARLGCW